MQTFTEQKFNIPKSIGISERNVEEHLKLYAGYVKNANSVLASIEELAKDSEKNAYVLGELVRRFSFEYNGMRNHEIYFSQFEGGPKSLDRDSPLAKAIAKEWGSVEAFLQRFKALALTRGIGWAMLWRDKKDDRLLMSWVDEQHLGQLQDCTPILALDMWEHSYVADYMPSGKKKYIEDFFANVNWEKIMASFR